MKTTYVLAAIAVGILSGGCMLPPITFPPRPLPLAPDVIDRFAEPAPPPASAPEPSSVESDGESNRGDGAPRDEGPLHLDEVLDAVDARFPLLLAVEEELEVAAGKLLSASGAFDTRLGASSELQPMGYYENYRNDVYLAQPTRLWGTEILGGYRLGRGTFPDYEGKSDTNDGGEVRLGLAIPLLRDRAIDPRRAREWQARIAREGAEPEIMAKRIGFMRDATKAYWSWVAAGGKREVARTLLALAETRRAQLEEAVGEGLLPEIVITDNQRLVAERQAILFSAQRALERAALALSLFHRDADGSIISPDESRLPAAFPDPPEPAPEKIESDIALAHGRRPELRSLALDQTDLEVELRLLENSMLPRLGLKIGGSQDLGASTDSKGTKDPFELRTGLEFSVPLGRSVPRGTLQSLRAKIRQLALKSRHMRDKIEVQVRDAASALVQSSLRISAARSSLELAERMEEAEQLQLVEGNSDLLRVNLREQQSASAASFLLDVTEEYFRARADYRAAVGVARVD